MGSLRFHPLPVTIFSILCILLVGLSYFSLRGSEQTQLETQVVKPAKSVGSEIKLDPARLSHLTISNQHIAIKFEYFQNTLALSEFLNTFANTSISLNADGYLFKIQTSTKSFVSSQLYATVSSFSSSSLETIFHDTECIDCEVKVVAKIEEADKFARFFYYVNMPQYTVESIEIAMIVPEEAPYIVGTVQGSPVCFNKSKMYFALEHPLSSGTITSQLPDQNKEQQLDFGLKSVIISAPVRIKTGTKRESSSSFSISTVLGVYTHYLRKEFQIYLSKARKLSWQPRFIYGTNFQYRRPEDPTLIYEDTLTESQLQSSIDKLSNELSSRGVMLNSFLIGDGWDDVGNSLWDFHYGFPQGFTNVKAYLKEKGIQELGVWISPWGGTGGKDHDSRIAFGKSEGFEVNRHGLALRGKRYSSLFLDTCKNMITESGVNLFKFDGIGGGGYADRATDLFQDDYLALIDIIVSLRMKKKDIFVELGRGFWPSPYWLFYGDSLWRGGVEIGFEGPTNFTYHQQWITFRDSIIYRRILARSPLFPLNFVDTLGIVYSSINNAVQIHEDDRSNWNNDKDLWNFACEVWSYVSYGVHLEELYLEMNIMTEDRWNVLSDAMAWAKSRAHILASTHWIGGSPEFDVYGHASFNSSIMKGVLTLRNPVEFHMVYKLDFVRDLELLEEKVSSCSFRSVWSAPRPHSSRYLQLKAKAPKQMFTLMHGEKRNITMAIGEVLVFDVSCT